MLGKKTFIEFPHAAINVWIYTFISMPLSHFWSRWVLTPKKGRKKRKSGAPTKDINVEVEWLLRVRHEPSLHTDAW